MRLIDGDALIEKFNEKTDLAECLVDARAAKRFATFCALADAVEEMPTVDAEVVVHGQWEESEDDWFGTTVYTCSKCREEFVLVEGTPEQNLWNYCPNCGAKMDGKEGKDG